MYTNEEKVESLEDAYGIFMKVIGRVFAEVDKTKMINDCTIIVCQRDLIKQSVIASKKGREGSSEHIHNTMNTVNKALNDNYKDINDKIIYCWNSMFDLLKNAETAIDKFAIVSIYALLLDGMIDEYIDS